MERLSQISLIVLASIVSLAALDAVSDIAAPVALALVVGVVLSPISEMWERLGLPPVFGALTSLLFSLVLIGGIVFLLQPLAAKLVAQAPKVWADVQDVVRIFRGLAQSMSDISRDVSSSVEPAVATAAAAPEVAPTDGMAVPTVTDALLLAPAVAAQIITFIGALFFFLLTRNDIYNWTARRLSQPSNRGVVATRLRDAERTVSRYFLTITLINAGLGLATAAALSLIGLDEAPLWGLIAFLLNYVVYLGPALMTIILLFTGVAAFDGVAALLPAIAFAGMNFIEGQFVTPTFVGKQMQMNPLLIFLSLLFGIWLWGAIGGIVAIPLMLWAIVLKNGLSTTASD